MFINSVFASRGSFILFSKQPSGAKRMNRLDKKHIIDYFPDEYPPHKVTESCAGCF